MIPVMARLVVVAWVVVAVVAVNDWRVVEPIPVRFVMVVEARV